MVRQTDLIQRFNEVIVDVIWLWEKFEDIKKVQLNFRGFRLHKAPDTIVHKSVDLRVGRVSARWDIRFENKNRFTALTVHLFLQSNDGSSGMTNNVKICISGYYNEDTVVGRYLKSLKQSYEQFGGAAQAKMTRLPLLLALYTSSYAEIHTYQDPIPIPLHPSVTCYYFTFPAWSSVRRSLSRRRQRRPRSRRRSLWIRTRWRRTTMW